ncbi:hydroxymethylglutaryl-CoA synthase 1 [Fopius arisanus]|uniref:Hydroxymethylglutaryl-CoA synthase n=1 Tax=Fopius arisanus TaxID=64838 RepID=A0A0C9RBP2_9HYME|nr:PREDICTED: hydroxymethylglutaryl-CoA synthase 1 [Fopius arisanus]XP_011309791.1 PREDICTED: hydroxymethylglutaryl-CoA synthase 1 [Fopius arisanus]XP_011309792.1 PREDICTED: hydroxymethylglutaryl-CoA synthase 1 [Fopius arisanus]
MWPKNVGIIALELYFPSQYVEQSSLERFDGVSPGKYTIGLGQSRMGFCNDREDVNSLCLTVTHRLLEHYNLHPKEIGHLEVGTETILDKSKSVKSILMQLFEPAGVTDVEGVDTSNACYGGTAALFNAISWVESSAWDGRLALVVAADNAVYAKGSARPTGGAGAIAILIGPDAPLVFDRGLRTSYMRHAYDFYKPDLRSEYPVVDGKLSIQCYLSALDHCYQNYCHKYHTKIGLQVTLNDFDAVIFHSPYCKLVQKSFARLAFMDFLRLRREEVADKLPALVKLHSLCPEETYFDRHVEKTFMERSLRDFEEKTKPSLFIANLVGNMYTPSVYSGLVSLLISKGPEELAGMRVAVFSYGSGLASSMYSISIRKDAQEGLMRILQGLSGVRGELEGRRCVEPEEYTRILELREKNCHTVPYQPEGSIDGMFPGSYYLVGVDDMHRRTYQRVPFDQ